MTCPVLHRKFISGLTLHRGFAEHVVDTVLHSP
jgi:hypothetical protein